MTLTNSTQQLRAQRATLADENGFTLVELLVVVLILAALVAIAVPAYINFVGGSQSTAAAADVREAVTDAKRLLREQQQLHGHDSPVAGVELRLRAPDLERRLDRDRVDQALGQRAGVLHLGRVGRPLERARRQDRLRPEHG
jgi:prepilin-type N-terminal cleavage/methylation domain-containing protein